ncbi:MAG TPA: chemotaxis protein CheB, partial [Burkholderiaceae bacterium]|nr:chemotaxis protein CheB [Burkholderiaceae bacterium]
MTTKMAKPRDGVEKSVAKSRASLQQQESPAAVTSFAEGELSPDHAEVELADVTDDAIPTRGYDTLPMVGLGGSAGSIQALQTFFSMMPADSGLAYVVVLHLSPQHESTLAELLQRWTPMPV